MGYWRNTGRAIAVFALSMSGTAFAAEPLITAKLADPETHLVPMDGTPAEPTPEQRNADFANAIAAASLARQQTVAAQCRLAVPSTAAARMAWEANCRYRRR